MTTPKPTAKSKANALTTPNAKDEKKAEVEAKKKSPRLPKQTFQKKVKPGPSNGMNHLEYPPAGRRIRKKDKMVLPKNMQVTDKRWKNLDATRKEWESMAPSKVCHSL